MSVKRYLVFVGQVFYPNAAMEDFVSDHDVLDDAIAAAKAGRRLRMEEEGENEDGTWSAVWDTHIRSYAVINSDKWADFLAKTIRS